MVPVASHNFVNGCCTRTRVPTGMRGKVRAWTSCRSLAALFVFRWEEARSRELFDGLVVKLVVWEGIWERSWRPKRIWAGDRPSELGVLRHSSRPEANASLSSTPEGEAFCRSRFMAFTAASAWPLDLGWWGEDIT